MNANIKYNQIKPRVYSNHNIPSPLYFEYKKEIDIPVYNFQETQEGKSI